MEGKKLAIVQSNYIPWKGYFDLINSVNEFILFDDMQYTRRSWRNRNKIKTRDGVRWLTIPVAVKGRYYQKIIDTRISDPRWGEKHFNTIRHSYARAPYFRQYEDLFAELYLNCNLVYLSEINYRFLSAICDLLGIRTRLSWSSNYRIIQGKTERIVDLCKQAGASCYVTGPAAEAYLDEELFAREGITLTYMHYSEYAEYPQLFPPFEHAVSFIDLLFNTGSKATHYMKSF